MIINNNIPALNTYRQMGANQSAAQSSMEKLASGLRINKAGDDAAGLAISEKMRAQIRGLDQASRNSQDGISMIQTAEGALQETQNILQRMRELATQAANDTNVEVDRNEIQKEINQLSSEINRIGNTTEFNTQRLLNGDKSTAVVGAVNAEGTREIGGIDVVVTGEATEAEITVTFAAGAAASGIVAAWNDNTVTITIGADATNITADQLNAALALVAGDAPEDGGAISFSYEGEVATQAAFGTYSITVDGGAAGEAQGQAMSFQIGANQNQALSLAINDMRSEALGVSSTGAETQWVEISRGHESLIENGTMITGDAAVAEGLDANKFYIQATFTNDNGVTDGTNAAGAERGLSMATHESAAAAVTIINDAIERVSAERSMLGATQNRLEHTISNLNNASENLSAAESRIRDVDMAREVMDMTKNNILAQASQAMLAQANQAPQAVLQLLG